MKKIIVSTVAAFLTFASSYSSHGAIDEKVVAVLDTYVNSAITKQVIHEVCTTTNKSCLNGSNFMEGVGAANVLQSDLSANGIQHGQYMASTVAQANPNTKIVFIRIHNVNRYKDFNAIYANDESIIRGLKWVYENAQKYSIDAVSISQARHNFPQGTCPKNINLDSYVSKLKDMSIPVFAGVGNGGWWNRTGFPACADNVIGVGSSSDKYTMGTSNMGDKVDFFSIGYVQLKSLNNIGVSGTSVATAYISSVWVNKFSGSWDAQYSTANSEKTRVSDRSGKLSFIFINN